MGSASFPVPAASAREDALAQIGKQAAEFARSSRSQATQRAYRSDLSDFQTWAASAGLTAIPAQAETIGLYLTARAGNLKVSTLRRRLAAIAVAHRFGGYHLDTSHPAIKEVMAGIRRQLGSRPNPKNAITVDDLRAMVRKLPDSVAGIRDRAILLIGFAGAFRRSEISALDGVDIKVNTRGVAILVRRSKTDQEGQGQVIGIPRSRKATCPVGALEAWIAAARVGDGPLFRPISRHGHIYEMRLSDEAIADIVKRSAARIGLDPSKYAGHSLRRGFATAASAAGVDLAPIMRQTRHRSVAVAMQYVDEGKLFSNPASRAIGL